MPPEPINPIHLGELGLNLFEAAPDPIFVIDPKGHITLVNREAERAFGYARDELVGQSVEVLIPERLRGSHVSRRENYQRSPHTRPMGSGVEITARRKDGSEFPAEASLSPVVLEGVRYTISILRDVSERAKAQEQLRFLSTHDALTGLYNRTFFEEERLRLERGRIHPISIIMLDVDGLKEANDLQGHSAGDLLLRKIASLLRSLFRAEDVIARIGGDEFVVLLPGLGEEPLQDRLSRLRESNGEVQFSVGGATSRPGQKLSVVLRQADAAMYAEKRSRKMTRSAELLAMQLNAQPPSKPEGQ